MLTRNIGSNHRCIRCIVLLLSILLLALAASACSADSPTTSIAGTQTVSSPQAVQATATLPASPAGPAAPSPTSQTPVLQGSKNFLLSTPLTFSSVSGGTADNNQNITPIDANTIKSAITGEMKHLLFVMGADNAVKVYSPGVSPVTAHVTQNTDGSMAIEYTQTVDSEAGTVTILFDGMVQQGQIAVSYEQRYTPSILINALASDVAVSFATRVQWVTADQIPASPRNGAYQLTSKGGVALTWSAGQHAVAYDVYRQISDQDQQFQWLTTVKSTSYTDNSSEAIQHVTATKGVTYVIFSVGSTGVENPGGIVISL